MAGEASRLETKAWDVLRDFESQDRIKAAYKRMHGRDIRTEHAREISAPFSHGRSYFDSASTADPTIEPLLLYYGVLNLSRGLTLVLSRSLREAALKPSHGLTCEGWAERLRGKAPEFHALRVRAGEGGAFIELSNATARCTMLRHKASLVNMASRERGKVNGHSYTLGDILARIPHLERSNVAWRNVSLCSTWGVASRGDGTAVLRISKKHRQFVDRAYCDALFANTDYSFKDESKEDFTYEGPDDFGQMPGVTDITDSLDIGQLWLVARYPDEVWLSRVEALFSIAYALGMVVRYFPMQWTSLLRGNIPDAILPTLLEAIRLVSWLYPVAVADLLTNQHLVSQLSNSSGSPQRMEGYSLHTG
jgi:hypothetical protein